NIARTYMDEGQTGKALEISLALKPCPIEFKRIHDEVVRLLADLQAVLPEGVIQSAMMQIEGELPADQAKAHLLAIAREFEHE
ncbi:MAG TPA: hypothetical protein VLA49_11650, partial [Anaerolineales bacterium]|nr:hypothetical protein [Anaerolineales bacterium]